MAYAVLGIIFVIFNVIAFAIPTAKTATFWVAYIFTVIAFALQLIIWKFAFKGADTLKSKFLGIPLISVGVIYLLVQIVAVAVFMALSFVPSWIAIVVCILILGISAVCLIGAETGREEVNRIEHKVSKKGFYIKSLQIDVEMLAKAEVDADTKIALTNLAEKIRFSDPMSDELLAELEAKIRNKFEELKLAEQKATIINELTLLIEERNKKCKLLK